MKNPCKNCPEREVGCHSRCEPYKAYKAVWEKLRKKAYRERDINYARFDGSERLKKAKNKAPKYNP